MTGIRCAGHEELQATALSSFKHHLFGALQHMHDNSDLHQRLFFDLLIHPLLLLQHTQDIDEEEGVRAVHEAFRLGINYFDTSPFYGETRSEQAGQISSVIPRASMRA